MEDNPVTIGVIKLTLGLHPTQFITVRIIKVSKSKSQELAVVRAEIYMQAMQMKEDLM